MKESIVMVASYGGPYAGNFIPSLEKYDALVKKLGFRTIYIFPEFSMEYHWVETMRRVADGIYFVPYRPYSMQNVKKIKEICKQENCIMIYSRMSGWDITAKLAMPCIPQIWHMEMGLNLSSFMSKAKYFLKYRIIGGQNVFHTAVSQQTTDVINSFGVRHSCEWIPNAINISRMVEKQPYCLHSPLNVLTFAYDPLTKGFDLVLSACEKLNQNETQYILMASAQKRTYEYVEERYGTDVPSWLVLLGPTDDIASIYSKADVMTLPSRSEGLPYALLEAIYSGLPTVIADIPGTQFATGFKNSFRFQKENVEELVTALASCQTLSVLEEDQSYNRQLILNSFSMDIWEKQIEKLILKALDESDKS